MIINDYKAISVPVAINVKQAGTPMKKNESLKLLLSDTGISFSMKCILYGNNIAFSRGCRF